jgi:hypothetical protein
MDQFPLPDDRDFGNPFAPPRFMILALPVYIAGFLAFCVGIIFTLPLAFLMFAVTYLALSGTASPPRKKADLIWEDEL